MLSIYYRQRECSTYYLLMNDNIFKSILQWWLSLTDRHNALLTSLYATAFTNSFPAHLRSFNDSRNEEMIEKPDMDKAVFCRVIRTPADGGDIRFPKSQTPQNVMLICSGEEVTLEEGNIFLIRYSAVKKYIIDGDVELI